MENLLKTARKGIHFFIRNGNWQTIEYFDHTWMERIRHMAAYIPAKASVLDLGCGKMWVKNYLKNENQYYPVDYTSRGPDTIICDFNKHEFPSQIVDTTFVSGVLEYVQDAQWLVECISKNSHQCVLSYCILEDYPNMTFRRKQAWVNAFTHAEIISLFSKAGFSLMNEEQIPSKNRIFNFVK